MAYYNDVIRLINIDGVNLFKIKIIINIFIFINNIKMNQPLIIIKKSSTPLILNILYFEATGLKIEYRKNGYFIIFIDLNTGSI